MTELREQVTLVHWSRETVASEEQILALAKQTFEANNAALMQVLAKDRQLLQEREATLRDMTLAAYRETGSKKPGPGVAIRVVTRLEYDADKALEWARAHDAALMLDRKAFEGIAKSGSIGPDIVKRYEDATATIATELGAALREATV